MNIWLGHIMQIYLELSLQIFPHLNVLNGAFSTQPFLNLIQSRFERETFLDEKINKKKEF